LATEAELFMALAEIDIDGIAQALHRAAVDATPAWVSRSVLLVAGMQSVDTGDAGVLITDAGDRARVFVDDRLGTLLNADIDRQRSTPLSVFRDAARFPVEVLHQLGAQPVQRVDVERWASPNDPFGVTPATLADVGEAVQEAGIMWGAAKAAIHLQRRRDEGQR
jgi:hypothetical protein